MLIGVVDAAVFTKPVVDGAVVVVGVGATVDVGEPMSVFVADACCVSKGFCTVVAMSAFQWEVSPTKTWVAEVDSRSIDAVKQIMLKLIHQQKH